MELLYPGSSNNIAQTLNLTNKNLLIVAIHLMFPHNFFVYYDRGKGNFYYMHGWYYDSWAVELYSGIAKLSNVCYIVF